MPSARTHHTPNACTPKPGSNNQTFRNWPASKSSNVKLNVVKKADHSRTPSSCLDSKHLVCLTCQKCVFYANHDVCVTKFLKEVNSHVKIQSLKSGNSIKLVGKKSNANKPERPIFKGHRLSRNKSSAMHEKTSPTSSLRWKPTGIIFKTVGLRWVPTGKIFTDSTTKVDSKPPNGSNDDITNLYECDQTLNISASTLNLSAAVPPTKNDWDSLFQPMFDEYFKPPPNVDHPVPALVPAASTSSPSSTIVDQDAPSTSTSQTTSEQLSSIIPQGVEDDFHDIEVAYMDNDPYFGIPIPEPSSEETTLQGVIPSNLHHLNQSFDTLTKLKKKHPLENVIGDPSRPVSTRSQLQEHAIQCYFDANDNPISFGGKWSG
ncbi:hypothetical protein Tco_0047494 [Tanacetum coccineum]